MRLALLTSLCFAAASAAANPLCDYRGMAQVYDAETFCVSSALAPQSGNAYNAGAARDGYNTTAWCEGAGGFGIGQVLSFDWRGASPIDGLYIVNGYAKSNSIWQKNARISEIILRFWGRYDSAPREIRYRLYDSPAEQSIPIPWADAPRRIEIQIDGVYPGSKWQDTCVSEIWADFGM